MKLKDRIKTYNFWVSLASAIFLILQIAGQKLGFNVDEGLFNDLFTSLCSILVILGIIVPPTSKEKTSLPTVTIRNHSIDTNKSNYTQETANEEITNELNSQEDGSVLINGLQNVIYTNESSCTETNETNIEESPIIFDNTSTMGEIQNQEAIIGQSEIQTLGQDQDINQTTQNSEIQSKEEDLKELLSSQLTKLDGNKELLINILQEQIKNLSE